MVVILSKVAPIAKTAQKKLRDGDIIYTVREPQKRVVVVTVGHIAIVGIKSGELHIIDASGSKR